MSRQMFSEAFENLRARHDIWEERTERFAALAMTDDRPRRRWWRRLALLTVSKIVNEQPKPIDRSENSRASAPGDQLSRHFGQK